MAKTIRRESVSSLVLHRLLDVALNVLALAAAYAIKESLAARGIRLPTQPLTAGIVLHTFVAVTLIWLGVTSALETYRFKRRLFPEIVNLTAALLLTIAFFNTYVFFTRLFDFPRLGMVLYALIGTALLATSRGIKESVRRALHRRGRLVKQVVIVGTGAVASRLARAIRTDHALGYRLVGFIGDGDTDIAPVLGTLDSLERVLDEHPVDELIIALPAEQHARTLEITERCQARAVRIRVVPDLFDAVVIRATIGEIDDIPLIGLRDPAINGAQSVIKRLFDLAVASFLLVLCLPLFLILPVLIWLDSRGRAMFVQERVGENGRPFRMYKFRSMVPEAEKQLAELIDLSQLSEPVYKLKDDPRITRVGRWLRRTSLDELPQLINVLKGEMSMVGPRPEAADVVAHYNAWHRKRLAVKPGITGPMQVGGRGELSLDDRISLELLYISQYSLLEDVKYLLRTIPAVCRGRGAY
ncbi:MAG: sugar transferase [Phycisphaerae bacterium]|nr:sugar transferase [Phycisphaerae bacterium]